MEREVVFLGKEVRLTIISGIVISWLGIEGWCEEGLRNIGRV